MRQVDAVVEGSSSNAPYPDQPNRSPWIAQLRPGWTAPAARCGRDDRRRDRRRRDRGRRDRVLHAPLDRPSACCSIERDRVARGATGRNAGQLTTYFERPLSDIADEFGPSMAVEAQRAFDDAHDLLDLMVAEAGASVRVERFTGHMGMFSLNHLAGAPAQQPASGATAGCGRRRASSRRTPSSSDEIPAEFASLYSVVPQARIRELLEIDDDRYRAVLSDRKGCANSGLLVQQVLAYLERTLPGPVPVRRPDPRRPDRRRRRCGVVAPRRRRIGSRRRRSCCARTASSTTSVEDAAGDADPPRRRPADRRHGRVHGGVRRGAAADARRR